MKRKTGKTIIIYAIIFAFLFVSVPAPEANMTPAQRSDGYRTPGNVVERLPAGYMDVWVGKNRYYHHDGVFYRRGPTGFIVVNPPIGSLVLSLPLGAMALLIGGITYYLCGGICYRNTPGGFEIVEMPDKLVVKEISPVVPSEESVGETISVIVPLLNVRSGPGASFPVIFQVREGESLIVHGYAPDWLYVKSQDNEHGWVMLRYTSSALSQSVDG